MNTKRFRCPAVLLPSSLLINSILVLLLIISMASFTGCAYTNGVMQSALDSSEIDANTLTAQAGGNLSALASLEDMGDAYSTPEGYQNLQDKGLSTTQQILKTAYSQMGKPYKYGGTSPQTGFDCAGFVQWCYQQSGIDLPRTSKEMLSVGSPVDKDDLRPGDILVYGSYRGRGVTHAGIYIGNGRYIHSPNTGDRIKESEAFDKYHRAHFIAARRVLNEPGATPLADQHKEQLVAKALAENANLAVKQSKSNSKSNKSDGGFVYYQVKKGDVPSAIARRYKISTDKLLAANGLGPKKVLKVGQKLKIPGQSTTTTTATAESVQSRTSETKSHKKTATTQYVVKSGDVMSAIASRFNVTTKSLLQANKLTSSSKLRIGQKLTIPGAASVAETKSAGSKPMANKSYSVKSGDSLWLIAQRFGVSVSSLTKVNSLGDHELKIGQELRIP